ncbi:hypothetical protein DH2020_039141 [Rehmannia glutinosa]|uniref:Oleosin n=1 Tax=Rehmannia glutinosa TaxID=99300 RepID=A0ABR0UWL5_REHGL
MADRDRSQPHQFQIHRQPHPRYEGSVKDLLPSKGPSAVQILAIITLLPIGGSLLGLAGITLVGTLIGLAVATPYSKVTGQEPLEYARRRVQVGIIQVGEKTKQVGEMVGEKTKQTGDTIKTKVSKFSVVLYLISKKFRDFVE